MLTESGPGKRSPYRDSLGAGRSGHPIPVGGDIFRTRPDRPWAHPASYTRGTGPWGYNGRVPGLSREKSGRGVVLTTHPHLSAEVKKG